MEVVGWWGEMGKYLKTAVGDNLKNSKCKSNFTDFEVIVCEGNRALWELKECLFILINKLYRQVCFSFNFVSGRTASLCICLNLNNCNYS